MGREWEETKKGERREERSHANSFMFRILDFLGPKKSAHLRPTHKTCDNYGSLLE